jgi:hypothetical protein
MDRNTQIVGLGGRNAILEDDAVEFSRTDVDTGNNGELTITVDGADEIHRATVTATAGSYKACVVPQGGDQLLVVILNDADNTPNANSSDITDIEGIAYSG